MFSNKNINITSDKNESKTNVFSRKWESEEIYLEMSQISLEFI